MDQTLKSYLESHGIIYQEYKHPAVFTVAESRKLKIKIPGLHTKSLFFKDEHNNFYLVCLPGEKRLNTKPLKNLFSIKELQFAPPQELKEELELTPGSVSLFALIHAKKTTLILDQEIWNAKLSGFHPNINTSTLVISHENLEKFYNSLKIQKHILKLD